MPVRTLRVCADSIFHANLRKSPLDDDVDLHALANITDGFSGADITEVCQRACKLAIRAEIAEQEAAEAEAIAAGKEAPPQKMDGTLSKKHFDEAMKTARKSVSKTELQRYLKFKKELSGGGSLKAATAEAEAAAAAAEGEDLGDELNRARAQQAAAAAAGGGGDADDEELYD